MGVFVIENVREPISDGAANQDVGGSEPFRPPSLQRPLRGLPPFCQFSFAQEQIAILELPFSGMPAFHDAASVRIPNFLQAWQSFVWSRVRRRYMIGPWRDRKWPRTAEFSLSIACDVTNPAATLQNREWRIFQEAVPEQIKRISGSSRYPRDGLFWMRRCLPGGIPCRRS